MTFDVVALCREQPEEAAVRSALTAAGPDLGVQALERGGLVQLCDDDGQPLVTIEGPMLVQVLGEVQRLLGIDVDAPYAVWWVEVRATDRHAEAAGVARRLGAALVEATGGQLWSSR